VGSNVPPIWDLCLFDDVPPTSIIKHMTYSGNLEQDRAVARSEAVYHELELAERAAAAYARARREVFDVQPAAGLDRTERQRCLLVRLERAEGELRRFRTLRRAERAESYRGPSWD
jgi:hypothetical protein